MTTAADVPFGGARKSGIGRHCSEIGLKSSMEARIVSLLRG
jgi:acyl-CoA reductase-like NAD-dependent aldehyde dehydrogenase